MAQEKKIWEARLDGQSIDWVATQAQMDGAVVDGLADAGITGAAIGVKKYLRLYNAIADAIGISEVDAVPADELDIAE